MRRLFVPILSADPELGLGFVHAVLEHAPEKASSGAVMFERYHAFVESIASDPDRDTSWAERVRLADAVALLIHYLDEVSLQAVRARVQKLAAIGKKVPTGIFIVREPNEHEFKISCGDCSQKLWVRESDIGRRGRCTNCRKPMIVPTPSEYLRNRLALPDGVPVLNVVRGDAALCRGVLANLLARVSPDASGLKPGPNQDFLKQATVPISL